MAPEGDRLVHGPLGKRGWGKRVLSHKNLGARKELRNILWMDERHFPPPKKAGNDGSPYKYQEAMASHGSRVVRTDVVDPVLVRKRGTRNPMCPFWLARTRGLVYLVKHPSSMAIYVFKNDN